MFDNDTDPQVEGSDEEAFEELIEALEEALEEGDGDEGDSDED